MNEIVKIDPSEYGLEETKAKQIEEAFKPMLEKMTELEAEFNEIVKLEITPVTVKKAKELRLKYVKVRTGTANIHKELKTFYLSGCRFIDGWKNAQSFASQGNEDKLKQIEDYYENLEKERIAKIQDERASELIPFLENHDVIPSDLGSMNTVVWINLLAGAKANHNAKIEAEKKAEEDRLEAERLDKIETERYNQAMQFRQFWSTDNYAFREMSAGNFNSVLADIKKRKEEYEKEQAAIRAENERLKVQAEAAERERLLEEQRRKEKEDKERAEYEAKLEEVRKEREKIEAELKAAKEAQEAKEKAEREAAIKAEKEKIEAEKKAAKAPDKDKIKTAIKSLSLEIPACKTKEAEKVAEEISLKFSSFKRWAENLIETI